MKISTWMYRQVWGLFGWLAVAMCGPAYADLSPLNGAAVAPNIAEIRVLKDSVEVSLEVYVGNLEVFQDLLPDTWFKGGAAKGRPAEAERLRLFAETGLQVRADGKLLEASVVLAEPRRRIDRLADFARSAGQLTGTQIIPKPPEDDRVFYVELIYPFDGQPAELEFSPPVQPPEAPRVSIGFVVFHGSVHVMDFRYLSGPEILRLDWSDPWYSRFTNRNLKRHHDSGLLTFLYVEPRDVRHETLIRVRDLQDFVDLGLDPEAQLLTVEDQARITETARAFFADLSPLEVDGSVIAPTETRAEFLSITTSGVRVSVGEEDLDPATALVGVIISYPVTTLPQNVSIRWPLFNERIPRVPATTFDPAGPFLTLLDPEAQQIEWINYLTQWEEPVVRPLEVNTATVLNVPWLTGILVAIGIVALLLALRGVGRARSGAAAGAGAAFLGAILAYPITTSIELPGQGAPDIESAHRVVAGLLDNISTAMLETEEAQFEAALDAFVAAENVDAVGPEIRRGLTVSLPSGARARIEEITDLTVEVVTEAANGAGHQVLASWSAQVSGGHWGHLHRRTITYRGLADVFQNDGTWYLSGLTILGAQEDI